VSWEFDPDFGAAQKAAISSEKNIVYISPPAMWTLNPILSRLPESEKGSLENLFLVPGVADALELNTVLSKLGTFGSCHPVTGIARASRMAREGVTTLVATPGDTLALLKAAAQGIRDVRRVFIWSTDIMLERGESENLDTILAECSGAQRIIHATDIPTDFAERHARRAPVVQVEDSERVTQPIRYALMEEDRSVWAVRKCLDIVDPGSVMIWDPSDRFGAESDLQLLDNIEIGSSFSTTDADLAIATDLPSPEILQELLARGRDVIVLIRPRQLPFLQKHCGKLKPIKLPSDADRARDRAFHLRHMIRDQIAANTEISFTLGALEPLFYDHDPAVVAAALANVAMANQPAPSPIDDLPAWVKLFLTIGERDKVTVRDVVGAILNSTGISRDSVGKVEVRDTFTLVEVRPVDAERVVSELNGSTLRDRRITARIDRKGRPAR
jgi:hypothetical protein